MFARLLARSERFFAQVLSFSPNRYCYGRAVARDREQPRPNVVALDLVLDVIRKAANSVQKAEVA
jgi:hypothetical protein